MFLLSTLGTFNKKPDRDLRPENRISTNFFMVNEFRGLFNLKQQYSFILAYYISFVKHQ
jgi:hypothetical protein